MPLPLRRTPLNTKNKTNNVKPIVVTDPNDKRLRAYNDSNTLYKKSEKTLRNTGNSSRNTPIYVKKGVDAKEFEKPSYNFVGNQTLDVSGKFDANMNPNNNFPKPKIKQKILPIAGIGVNEGNSMGGWVNIYKKPVQPVVYQKESPIKKQKAKGEQVKPVPQKLEVKKPEVKKPSGEGEFKQGRKFMKETGLRPGFYKKDELANNPNKKIPIKRR